MVQPSRLEAALVDAVALRRRAASGLGEQAGSVTRACQEMAAAFGRGGKLVVFGVGAAGPHARHIAVEFVHPVIVGKPALPALCLGNEVASVAQRISRMAAPHDVAIGLTRGHDVGAVTQAFGAAKARDLVTVALTDEQGRHALAGSVDHVLVAPTTQPQLVTEAWVSLYHLLWETVHLLMPGVERSTTPPDPGDVSPGDFGYASLYPFLADQPRDMTELLSTAEESAVRKLVESAALRGDVVETVGDDLIACARAVACRFEDNATLFSFGNGGSACDAEAVARMFDAPAHGRALAAHCLGDDVPAISAIANDVGFDVVFARQLDVLARRGDIAVALSTSGSSNNVIHGLRKAKQRGLVTVGLAGYQGGAMLDEGLDHLFVVPSSSVHRIQEAQATLCCILWELVQIALSEPTDGP